MYVYGIQSGQFIKVGAANDIQKRLHTFRLYNPLPLKVILRRVVKENYWVEKQMHRSLAQYAIGREWFDCSPDLVRTAFEEALKELIANRQAIVGSPKGWVDSRVSF
jgi:hypothetical protein